MCCLCGDVLQCCATEVRDHIETPGQIYFFMQIPFAMMPDGRRNLWQHPLWGFPVFLQPHAGQ